MQHRT